MKVATCAAEFYHRPIRGGNSMKPAQHRTRGRIRPVLRRGTASHRRRALLAAVLLALPAAGPQVSRSEPRASEVHRDRRDSAQPPTLEALMRGMAGAPGVVAHFREEKQLALLSEPLES